MVYVVPGVTVSVSDVVDVSTIVRLIATPTRYPTLYSVIGLPPVLGGSQDSAKLLPVKVCRIVPIFSGAVLVSGASPVITSTVVDHAPLPSAFTALTRIVYVSPADTDIVTDVPVGSTVFTVPPLSVYSTIYFVIALPPSFGLFHDTLIEFSFVADADNPVT